MGESSQSPRRRTALAVMARCPVVGQVKTRLARVIGTERACALYGAFLRDIETRFRGGHRALVWAYHPPSADFSSVVGPGARCLPQTGQDLGERLLNCFRRLCGDGFEPVIIIGGDAPHVRDEWLNEAEQRLGHADVVLGPSTDGGYYLVAMRVPHDVFTGIKMSTASVLAETVHKADTAGLRVHLLPQSFDVDEADDLVRLRRLLAGDGCDERLPHTAAMLKSWE